MSKRDRLQRLIDYYSGGNKTQFANKLGITPQGISSWVSRDTFDIELVYAKCENVSAQWLLTGEGEMCKTKDFATQENVSIPDLISQLKEQAEEIGRLKERITTLEREKGKSASHALTADAADAV